MVMMRFERCVEFVGPFPTSIGSADDAEFVEQLKAAIDAGPVDSVTLSCQRRDRYGRFLRFQCFVYSFSWLGKALVVPAQQR